jgi:hypothetical protein
MNARDVAEPFIRSSLERSNRKSANSQKVTFQPPQVQATKIYGRPKVSETHHNPSAQELPQTLEHGSASTHIATFSEDLETGPGRCSILLEFGERGCWEGALLD